MLQGNAIVGQSGGPTAAINATLAGVIFGATQSSDIHTLYGARNGIEGVLRNDLIDLSARKWSHDDIRLLASTPAALLGSCRHKLTTESEYEKILNVFKQYDIRFFFYIGGNDSMDTVAKLSQYMQFCDYEMRIIGIPKTIDNDLCGTHHTPGYGSAAKFVATTMQEIIRDAQVYTKPSATIVEIMGRDAGWLTAAAALAKPDLVYLPERKLDVEYLVRDIDNAMRHHPNIVVAVSEGLRDTTGKYISASGKPDAFGHKMLCGTAKRIADIVSEQLGCKTRAIELNVLQRCASHCASAADVEESLLLGSAAVSTALHGASGQMMSINNGFECVSAEDVANRVKQVPLEFINRQGNYVTDKFLEYVKPLIQGEAPVYWENGLPKYFTL